MQSADILHMKWGGKSFLCIPVWPLHSPCKVNLFFISFFPRSMESLLFLYFPKQVWFWYRALSQNLSEPLLGNQIEFEKNEVGSIIETTCDSYMYDMKTVMSAWLSHVIYAKKMKLTYIKIKILNFVKNVFRFPFCQFQVYLLLIHKQLQTLA